MKSKTRPDNPGCQHSCLDLQKGISHCSMLWTELISQNTHQILRWNVRLNETWWKTSRTRIFLGKVLVSLFYSPKYRVFSVKCTWMVNWNYMQLQAYGPEVPKQKVLCLPPVMCKVKNVTKIFHVHNYIIKNFRLLGIL